MPQRSMGLLVPTGVMVAMGMEATPLAPLAPLVPLGRPGLLALCPGPLDPTAVTAPMVARATRHAVHSCSHILSYELFLYNRFNSSTVYFDLRFLHIYIGGDGPPGLPGYPGASVNITFLVGAPVRKY